jgi:hypothetical protein
VLGLVGLFGLEISSTLGCNLASNNPPGSGVSHTWIFYTGGASVFVTLHMLGIIIQTASINMSLYKVPLKYGAFK